MKVFQINTVASYGSTGGIARGIADQLSQNGYESLISYGRGDDVPAYLTYKIGGQFGQVTHVLLSRMTDRHGFYSTNSTRKLIKKIDEYQPDIIQIHNLHGYYLNIKILFEFFGERHYPVVWLLHDQWAISGHSANFELTKEGTIPQTLPDRKMLQDYPRTIGIGQFEKNYRDKARLFTLPKEMHLITPSKWLEEMLQKSYLARYPIQTIHNGIDTEKFRIKTDQVPSLKEKWGTKNKIILLGVALNWDATKGLNDYIKLHQQLPEDQFQIVLVGVDPQVKRQLPEGIITVERTENVEQLVDIYNAADYFVNLTYRDNFPTVNLEAMASGTPVLTYATGGSAECLVNEQVGTSFETGQLQAVVDFLQQSRPKTAEQMATCREAARNTFSKEDVYAKYIDLYQGIFQPQRAEERVPVWGVRLEKQPSTNV